MAKRRTGKFIVVAGPSNRKTGLDKPGRKPAHSAEQAAGRRVPISVDGGHFGAKATRQPSFADSKARSFIASPCNRDALDGTRFHPGSWAVGFDMMQPEGMARCAGVGGAATADASDPVEQRLVPGGGATEFGPILPPAAGNDVVDTRQYGPQGIDSNRATAAATPACGAAREAPGAARRAWCGSSGARVRGPARTPSRLSPSVQPASWFNCIPWLSEPKCRVQRSMRSVRSLGNRERRSGSRAPAPRLPLRPPIPGRRIRRTRRPRSPRAAQTQPPRRDRIPHARRKLPPRARGR